jgi:hypothetical protein
MLEDAYEPLANLQLPGFAPSLPAGIDIGLAVRAADRPQSIADWRALLRQGAVPETRATVVLGRTAAAPAAATVRLDPAAPTAAAPAKRRATLWIGAAVAVLLAAGGAAYGLIGGGKSSPQPAPVAAAPAPAVDKAAQDAQAAAEAQRLKDQEELAKLRAEAAAREKAEQEAALRKRIEEETRQKLAAEAAERQRLEDEARQRAEAEAAARRKAEEEDKQAAEATENALRLATLDKQHVQVALTALGFDTRGTNGTFGPRSREMLAAWQKARNFAATGFLTSPENQALLKEASSAVSRFDDDQKRTDDAKKKADDEKAKAEAAAKAAPPAAPVPSAPAAPAPQQTAAAPAARSGPDGVWQGIMHCTPSKIGNDFSISLLMTIANGSGTWMRGGTSETGTHSVSLTVNGSQVHVARVFTPNNRVGTTQTATMRAQYDGGATISGAGPEANGGGRNCDINMRRVR